MLSGHEFREAVASNGQVYILCERLDMLQDIEQELLQGKIISVRCPAEDESATTWLQMFQAATKTTLSVMASRSKLTEYAWVFYKKMFRCQHYARNGVNPKKSPRDTGCPVVITVRVRHVKFAKSSKSRSKKPDAGYALQVQSNQVAHNHAKESAAALRFHRVSHPTQERLVELFKHHHSPATALETLRLELQAEYGDEYPLVSADRSVLPDLGFVFRLYYQTYAKEYGDPSDADLHRQLKELAVDPDTIAIEVMEGETIVAAVTPMMARVHQLAESGQVVFIDSSGNMDRHNLRVFLIMTWSAAGGLPLAVIVTSSEAQSVIAKGLEMLTSIVPDGMCEIFMYDAMDDCRT